MIGVSCLRPDVRQRRGFPGAFLRADRRGIDKLFAISGRGYYEARLVEAIEKPGDWSSRVSADASDGTPRIDAAQLVDATLTYQKTTADR